MWVIVGLTTTNPENLEPSSFPRGIEDLLNVYYLYGSNLFSNTEEVGSCQKIQARHGNTFGVAWTKDSVTFYRNGSVHYLWNISIDGPVWCVVQMAISIQISVVPEGRPI